MYNMKSLGVISLNFSNSKSLCNILDSLEMNYEIINNASEIRKFDKIILPGTGNFKNALSEMKNKNYYNELIEHCLKNKYLLGICLGMQMLLTKGHEGEVLTDGLGVIKGEVIKLVSKTRENIVHIGWNEISLNKNIPILKNITEEENFYFMHGYHVIIKENFQMSFSNLDGNEIVSVFNKGNLFGIQFHPEKSHIPGKKILKNFYDL